MNVPPIVHQYDKDRSKIRLYCYLTVLLIMGSMIIGVSSAVVQRVIDSEAFLEADANTPTIRYYRH